ncbi:uncharacterized protein BP5553_03167 [Venustampulla echinocandica]|uniref:Extracellular mutant protein 11 C-terminal domain-containing protein n=1 Tax=Venustampulla echinocandica TaxID=2656787 RepID=A0A370TTG6_9HELO|nr:uncharacterized protein BP5553_03167 [Venustampulla echinocandica]RDL38827.1 hypothetical protein BP5553_03167 [Venustampulla echinocandica]
MSGVTTFVDSRTSTPPGGIPHNRAAAMNLKVPSNPRRGISPAPTIQSLPSTAPNPGYTSNPSNGRNTFPNPQYPSSKTPEPSHERNIFNTTAGSSFEDTRSEAQGGFQGYEQDGYSDAQNDAADDGFDGYHRTIPMYPRNNDAMYPSEEVAHPRLHHKQSQSQLKAEQLEAPKPQYPPGISGRFQHPSSLPKLYAHLGSDEHILHSDPGVSKKRGHSSNGRFEAQTQAIPHQLHHTHREIWDQSLGSEESDVDESARLQGAGRGQYVEDSDEMSPGGRIESPTRQQQWTYIPSPDYDDESLKAMSFAELKRQSWDINSGDSLHHLPEKLQDRGATVDDKLDFLLNENESTYGDVFEQMPTAEWELAGDLILERMNELMQKIQAARAKKRKVVEGFEAVYEARENLVRSKTQKYEDKLEDMKNTGEVVLRGKRT